MAQQAKVVKVGPGGRNNGPRPKVENPGKVFKRILAYVMSRYKAQVIVVLCCILLAVFAQLQGVMFSQTLIDGYILPLLNSGSTDFSGLAAAIATAGEHDWKVLVEQGIDGREIECAVLCPKAGDEPEASWPGEIVLDHQNDDQFYDFDSKYMDASASHVEVPANLPVSVLEDVRDVARRAFKAVDGAGLSRVDTFVTPDGTVMVNEINTMPGFTPISMYPKAWDATGVSYTELITRLIEGVLR